MEDLTVPPLGADPQEIRNYISKLISFDYLTYGVKCAVGEYYFEDNPEMTDIQRRLLSLFTHTRTTIFMADAARERGDITEFDASGVVKLIHEQIILGRPDEGRRIFFRWCEYLYTHSRVDFGTFDRDIFKRMEWDERPDLDEWGMYSPYSALLD